MWNLLADAVIALFAVGQSRRCVLPFGALRYDGHLIWSLTKVGDPRDLVLACEFDVLRLQGAADIPTASIAAFCTASPVPRNGDEVFSAEAWNYLCDVMLLLLADSFDGVLKPLSLLVAPSVCTALEALVLNASEPVGQSLCSNFSQLSLQGNL